MAAGKNKLVRGMRVSWDDSGGTPRDLSGDLVPGSLTGPGFTAEFIDLTGESNAAENGLAGRKTVTISARFHANDTATTGSSTVLNATVQTVGTLTVQIGAAGAAPTTGDLEFEGEFVLLDAKLVNDGGKLVHECIWQPGTSTAPAWGTV